MRKIIVAKALIFNDLNQVLLIRRSETAPRRPLEWDFPGGFVDDDDESYQAACLREIQEETGVSVTSNHLELLYAASKLDTLVGDVAADVSWLYFRAHATRSDEVRLSYEHVEFAWANLDRAAQLINYDRQLEAIAYVSDALKAANQE